MSKNVDFTLDQWLQLTEQFPLVPRFRWAGSSYEHFDRLLTHHHIPHGRDEFGNLLLGADSLASWCARLRSGSVRMVLHAHLDHPGAMVMRAIGNRRYVALVQGGLPASLRGRTFHLCDGDGKIYDRVVIDHEMRGIRERWVSFRTKAEFELPVFLRGPDKNTIPADFDALEGWGLDDHLGCALLLHHFASHAPLDLLGILSVDEEIGGYGIRHLLRAIKLHDIEIGRLPWLLSFEAASQDRRADFAVGQGWRWRVADSGGNFDATMVAWGEEHSGRKAVTLSRGLCEAGIWTRAGGKAGCIVVPLDYAHQGIREGEWRAERAARSDVMSLDAAIPEIVSQWHPPLNMLLFPKSGESPLSPVIRVEDHVGELKALATVHQDYLSCLKQVLPLWNQINAKFEFETVRCAYQDWSLLREKMMASPDLAGGLAERAKHWCREVKQWTGISRDLRREIPLHLFFGAPFNACNLQNGIALSVEKISENDLDRVLVHELTHWWLAPAIAHRGLRPLLTTCLHEGLACHATEEILGLSPSQALGIGAEQYQLYEEKQELLRSYLARWLSGDLLTIEQRRHEIVRSQQPPHPFTLSDGGEWPKYGYYVALKAIAHQAIEAGRFASWVFSFAEEDFSHVLEFLNAKEITMAVAL